MSVITTTTGTEKLTRRLEKAGKNLWIAKTSGDSWGNYLVFVKGGRCIGSAGWTLAEAAEKVERIISGTDY